MGCYNNKQCCDMDRNWIYRFTRGITWDPGSLANGVRETSDAVTETGTALGDSVLVSAPYDLPGITCNGYISAANTVRVRIHNETAELLTLLMEFGKLKY